MNDLHITHEYCWPIHASLTPSALGLRRHAEESESKQDGVGKTEAIKAGDGDEHKNKTIDKSQGETTKGSGVKRSEGVINAADGDSRW